MRYMLLIYGDEVQREKITGQEEEAISSTAATVRMQNGKAIMTDDPFAETKEQLAGYNIVEAGNPDDALSIAARHPCVRAGNHAVEVRPIWVRS